MYFYSNTEEFKLESAELIGLYVDDYRFFHKQSFPLNPKYSFHVEKNDSVIAFVEKRNFYYDVFKEDKLNVVSICGPNGVGKTSLLNLIKDKDTLSNVQKSFFLFVDENGSFAATEPCLLKNGTAEEIDLNHKLKGYAQIFSEADARHEESSEILGKTIIEEYLAHPEIYRFDFNGVEYDGELITHFSFEFSDQLLMECQNVFVRKGFSDVAFLQAYMKDEPLAFFLINQLQGSYFNDVPFKSIKKEDCVNKKALLSVVNEMFTFSLQDICREYDYKVGLAQLNKEYNRLNRALKKTIYDNEGNYRLYQMKLYAKVSEKWDALAQKIDDFIRNIRFSNAVSVKSDVQLNPVKLFNDKSKRSLYDLSNGELSRVVKRTQLKFAFENAKLKKSCFCCFDEPDNSLHPEWSREFWDGIVESVRIIREKLGVQKWFSIFVTTHSPFLLSDMFKHNVIVLKDYGDWKNRDVRVTESEPIFAENIGKLLYKNFSLQKTIGELASKQIKKCIENPSSEESRYVIEQIADPLLKTLLKNRADNEKN